MRITPDDYQHGPAHIHELADRIMDRHGFDKNDVTEIRIVDEGRIEVDWIQREGGELVSGTTTFGH